MIASKLNDTTTYLTPDRKQEIIDKLRRFDSMTPSERSESNAYVLNRMYTLSVDVAGNLLLLKYVKHYATKRAKTTGGDGADVGGNPGVGGNTVRNEAVPRIVYDTDESFDVIKIAHEKAAHAKVATYDVRCLSVVHIVVPENTTDTRRDSYCHSYKLAFAVTFFCRGLRSTSELLV